MDIILFGMQGAGKGTQGKVIAERYGLDVFDTGAELRKLVKENNPLAQKVRQIMEAGHLVPTELVMEIIENFIQNTQGNILFDGIPRSAEQAKYFDDIIQRLDRKIKGIFIELTEEEAIERLTSRRSCPNCKTIYPKSYQSIYCENCENTELITRSDDKLESIKVRLNTYQNETIPVINEYENRGILTKVNGKQSIEKVSEDIFEILDPSFN